MLILGVAVGAQIPALPSAIKETPPANYTFTAQLGTINSRPAALRPGGKS